MSTLSWHTHPLLEEFDLEDRQVARWRFDQFHLLGFGEEQALLLAASNADLHRARSLVAAGCPLHLALEILV
jgi:hypothetical protein